MNIVIIEDEHPVAENLRAFIKAVRPQHTILKTIPSVDEALTFFAEKADEIDLIFSDISLSDGLSFSIFEKSTTSCPIIFCTAYEQFAIKAFETYGVDFILKPLQKERILKAFEKVEKLVFHQQDQKKQLQQLVTHFSKTAGASSLLVHYRGSLLKMEWDQIALFFIEEDHTYLITLEGMQYLLTESLEELENLMGDSFFRASRQAIVNRKAIAKINKDINRKLTLDLTIPFKKKISVSREKAVVFQKWLVS